MSIKTKHVYMFSFTKVILATKEVITATLKVMSATTKFILTNEEVITARIKIISAIASTRVIWATNKLVSASDKII